MPMLRPSRRKPTSRSKRPRRKAIHRWLEHPLVKKGVSYERYRDKVRHVYDGPQGAILAVCSMISLHTPLGDRLFRERKFDLRGARRILDVGSGAGQIARHVLKYADPEAELTCFDLSREMLRRARMRLKSDRPRYVVADLTRLPFGDGAFDCVTCGYVLEHVPDPRLGLSELARVMMPGARMFLLTTEDSFGGAWTSRMWCCRTYNRRELLRICQDLGLIWRRELWFTSVHKILRAGGICVEIVRQ